MGVFIEFRKIHIKIRERNNWDETSVIQKNEQELLEIIETVGGLCDIAYKQGLLALEEAVAGISPDTYEENLRHLILAVTDGMDADEIRDIGMVKYYAGMYEDYQALKYFMYLEGALSIQQGDSKHIITERLKAMLPHELYLKYYAERDSNNSAHDEIKEYIEALCKEDDTHQSSKGKHCVSQILENTILSISKNELYKIFSGLEDRKISMAMKGMDEKVRRYVFEGMPFKWSENIAETMMYMGPVSIKNIEKASKEIVIHILQREGV